MDITKLNDDELVALHLVESCVHKAIGKYHLDPEPKHKQRSAYHVWQDGNLICYFSILLPNIVVTPWEPYLYIHELYVHGRDLRPRPSAVQRTFNIADPDINKMIEYFYTLKCHSAKCSHDHSV